MDKQLSAHQYKDMYKGFGINLNDLGCVMLDLEPLPDMNSRQQGLIDSELYISDNPELFWIDGWVADKTPHITLMYGLLYPAKNLESQIETVLEGWDLKEVEIEEVGFFDSTQKDAEYWCIVAHIKKTDVLIEGNQRLEFLPHVNTFTGYKPHMTIAYINKNVGKEYRDVLIQQFNEAWKGKTLQVIRNSRRIIRTTYLWT